MPAKGGTDWPEVRIPATPATADKLESWLFDSGALSVTIVDAVQDEELNHAVLEPRPGEVRLWNTLHLVGLFPQGTAVDDVDVALQVAALAWDIKLAELEISLRPDEVWERSWMRDFKPMQFGPHFWICPSHSEPVDPAAINLMLDPGLAFGSGTHATTAQCLEWLATRSTERSESVLSGKRVVDFGCGSGVLAIAAALLGAEEVWAVDIDEQAHEATLSNACINRVAGRLHIGEPALLHGVQVDILLANILFQPLMELADVLKDCVRPGGSLVLSGLRTEQIEPLRVRYTHGFEFLPSGQRDGWALMTATRRS